MATLVPDKRHPALDTPEAERVDYLTVVASMAFADRVIEDSELARVDDLCRDLELSDAGRAAVRAAAIAPDEIEIDGILQRLRTSSLRFALLVDLIDVAYADETINPDEAAEIEHLATELHIDTGQIALVRRYVASCRELPEGEGHDKELAAPLAGAGVPIATLALASTFGLPVAAGLGLAAALGAGSYAAVRWLVHRSARRAPHPR